MDRQNNWTVFGNYAVAAVAGLALISCLLPVYGGSHRSQRTLCLSHLKQVATGTLIYLADNDNGVPSADSWMDDLYVYTKNEDIFNCPRAGRYGYALNEDLAGRNLTNWKGGRLNETVLYFECPTIGRSVTAPVTLIDTNGRHSGKNNVAYADGHVKAEPAGTVSKL